jgi:Domain of unknown function (DUF4397)
MYYTPYGYFRSDNELQNNNSMGNGGITQNNNTVQNNIIQNENMMSYVRLLHAAPKAPAVDVYVNDSLLVRNFNYREFTDYVKLPSGTYNLKVYATGDRLNPILETDLFVAPTTVTTVAVIRDADLNYSLFPAVEKPLQNITPGRARVRVAHFISNAPSVDIALPNGTLLYRDVEFKDLENYIELPPGRHTFEIRLAGTEVAILYIPNIRLRPDKYYTVYLVGLIGEEPDPQVLIPLDGITYLDL